MAAPKDTGIDLKFLANATPEQLQEWLTVTAPDFANKQQSQMNQRFKKTAPFRNAGWTGAGSGGLRRSPLQGMLGDLYGDVGNPHAEQNFGITKTDSGFDFTNTDFDALRQHLLKVGQKIDQNAAFNSQGLGPVLMKPLGMAASFGLPILAPTLAGTSLLGKFAPFAKAASIGAGGILGKSGSSGGGIPKFNSNAAGIQFGRAAGTLSGIGRLTGR